LSSEVEAGPDLYETPEAAAAAVATAEPGAITITGGAS
jgi:hypothetical protein